MLCTYHKYDIGDYVHFRKGENKDKLYIISEVVASAFGCSCPAYRFLGEDTTLYPESALAKVYIPHHESRREWEEHETRSRR